MPDLAPGIWPFLICRGRTVGSRVVITPEILSDGRQLTRLLAQRPPGTDRWPVPGRPSDLVVVVRDVVIDGSWLGTDAPVRDEESRPIQATEGAIIRGGRLVDDEVFQVIHQAVRGPFADFWQADDPGWEARISSDSGALVEVPAPWQVEVRPQGFASPDVGRRSSFDGEPEPAATPEDRSPQVVVALVLALAVAVVVLAFLLR